ncbi:hypothetical protein BD779DRAFT_1790955 [Infundibulicybe gibba]|nr:hypothetical protein BD779DRAFT_1790955 [Infundibulicybe gibba]
MPGRDIGVTDRRFSGTVRDRRRGGGGAARRSGDISSIYDTLWGYKHPGPGASCFNTSFTLTEYKQHAVHKEPFATSPASGDKFNVREFIPKFCSSGKESACYNDGPNRWNLRKCNEMDPELCLAQFNALIDRCHDDYWDTQGGLEKYGGSGCNNSVDPNRGNCCRSLRYSANWRAQIPSSPVRANWEVLFREKY